MKILSVDIGGSNIKTLLEGETPELKRRVPSGPDFTPEAMVAAIGQMRDPSDYDVLAIGLPTAIRRGKVETSPKNLGPGWVDFDFAAAFAGKPVRLINDAAMQAIGSYQDGKMLFLGLGTGLGTCMIAHHQVLPMELAHLPFKKERTFEEFVGEAYRLEHGNKEWRHQVWEVVGLMHRGLLPDDVCIGGGNAKRLAKHEDEIPSFVRLGENTNAFLGGFRVWQDKRFEVSVPVLGSS